MADTSTLVALTVQLSSLQQAKAVTTDPSARALIDAQLAMLTAQLTAEAQHQQSQADASSNLLNSLGLFSTLTNVVGSAAPSIVSLFVKR